MVLTMEPRRATTLLGAIIVCLILADLAGIVSTYYFNEPRLFGLVRLFDLDLEGNAPTFYSSLQLLFSSILLFVIGIARKRQEERDYLYWTGLALVFLFLSCDEQLCFHEKLSKPIRNAVGTSGPLFFAWVIPYGIFVFVIGLAYLRFLSRLPAAVRRLTICAGLLYIGGALGIELVGANYRDLHGVETDLTYALITTCEETLELVGVLIFNYGLMTYIDLNLSNLHFRISSSKKSSDV